MVEQRLEAVSDDFGAPRLVVRPCVHCTWSSEVIAALPEAEWVMFVGDEWMGRAPWAKVRASLGHRMTPMGLTPERYLVETFPTKAELTSIGLEP